MFLDSQRFREKKKMLLISVTALLFAAVMAIFSYISFSAADGVIKVGIVEYSRLYLREGPGIEYAYVKSPANGSNLYVAKGNQVVITEEVVNSKKETWYKIPCSRSKTGFAYVYDDKVENFTVHTIERDPEFETYLTNQKFPDSYKDDLRILHYFYPKWEFNAVHNNLDWEKCVDAEYALGVSLVDPSAISSWKSTQDGAYDWTTGKWTLFDYGLNAASREVIAYYMDPRNFLGADSVFQFLGQIYDESQTLEDLTAMLEGTFLANTVTDTDETSLNYPEAIYNLSKENGVNPYVISSIILQEVGVSGTSGSISGTVSGYEGYFNYFNILAYAHDGRSAIVNGLIYASGSGSYDRPWNTRLKAISGGIRWYVTNYVSEKRISLYTKRFNITDDYKCSVQYMTNIDGAASEAAKLASAYSDSSGDMVLKFYIPVFDNMPSAASRRPIVTGSPNNKLSSLSVAGYNIGPEFNTDTLKYSLIVPSDIETVNIDASSYDSSAKISGAGSVPLNYGANNVNITVTAENGDVRTYTIVISRQADENTPPTFTSPYRIEGTDIRGIAAETKVADLISAFNVTNGSVAVAGKNGNDTVGTGDIVKIYSSDGSEYKSFTVVIVGDVSGDGQILINDIIKIRNHLLGTSLLRDAAASAADVSGDGQILINDIIKIRNHLLGTNLIQQ